MGTGNRRRNGKRRRRAIAAGVLYLWFNILLSGNSLRLPGTQL